MADNNRVADAPKRRPGRPTRALKSLMPEILGHLEQGVSHEALLETLAKQGHTLNPGSFKSVIYRYRQKLKAGEAVAHASPVRRIGDDVGAGLAPALPAQSQSERLAAALDPTKRAERASAYLEMKPPIFGAKPKVQE